MANPIKTSDLFENSGELKQLIAELEKVQVELGKLQEKEIENAKGLEEALKKSTKSTRKQKEELELAAKQAAEIERRFEAYNASLGENAKKIAALKLAQQQINQVNKLEAKLLTAKEGSYNAISAQLSLNKIRLKQLTAEERKSTEEGRKLVEETNKLNDALKELDAEIGVNVRNVGNYKSAFEGLPSPIKDGIDSVQGFRESLKLLLKNPVALFISAIVVSLTAIVNAFRQSQEGADLFNEKFEQVKAVLDVVNGRLSDLASAAISLFSGDFDGAAEKAKSAFRGVGKEIQGAILAAKELNDLSIAIENEQIQIAEQSARLRRNIKENNKIAEDTTKGTKKREEATKRAIQLSRELLNAEQSLLVLEADRLEAEFQISNGANRTREQQLKTANARAAILNKEEEILELQTTLQNKLNSIRDEAARKNQAQIKANEEAQQKALKFEEQSVKRLEDRLKSAKQNLDLGANKGIVANAFGEGLEQSEREISAFIDRLAMQLETATGAEALSILEQLLGAEKALQAGRMFKADLQDVLDNDPVRLSAEFGSVGGSGDATEVTRIAKEQIEKIKEDLAQDNEPQSVFDLLGFNLNTGEEDALKSSLDIVKQQLTEFANFRAQIAAQNVAQSNSEVAAAQRALDAELERSSQGLANNIETREKELVDAKKNQQKALQEQERAQKAQLAIQSIQQTSNLITASSKIYSQVGNPVFAIPLIALMWGSFIASKVRAAQLTKKQFGKGTYEIVGGGSHASGNDTYAGFESGGKPAYVEQGEGVAVIPKTKTNKYKSILPDLMNSLIKGDFEQKYQRIGAVSDGEIIPSGNVNFNADNKGVESRLDTIASQNEKRYFNDSQGNLVEKYKNVTRTYVK